MSQRRVRTRFAPSPTGELHAGNARVAVLSWLFARHHDGDFLLRIEDTDLGRNVAGAEAGIVEDLRWLGIEPDEGPGLGGDHGPYRQSDRLEFYRRHADRLLADGRAYPCYCTTEELERRREAALEQGLPPAYDGTCRALDASAIAPLKGEGRAAALRFRMPESGTIEVQDAVRGGVPFEAAELGDFVILRSDGLPTYNFAVVVDDALMEVSHVIRGVGHLSNTPRQVALYHALGWAPPVFAHVPTVLGPDRQKLSKRHGATSLAQYRREGVHPDALLNYLSLLSWSSPSGEELLSRERLVAEISLERLRASDVVFDDEKLRWLSARHIERMELAELVERVRPHLSGRAAAMGEAALAVALGAVRSHLRTFGEADALLEPFRADAPPAAPPADGGRAVLEQAAERLRALEEWGEQPVAQAIREAGKAADARGPRLYHPLRLAVTGQGEGPPLAALITVLGRDEAVRRLERAVAAG